MIASAQVFVSQDESLLSVAIFLGLIVAFIVVTLSASHIIGPRRSGRIKQMPYESGIDPVGSARRRINPRFYLIGLVFLLFDVELAFFYPWAKLLGGSELADSERLVLFFGMVGFAGLLILAYAYAWVKGVFRWP